MSDTGAPRAALLGTGSISNFHVPALRAAGFEVTAVAGRPGSTTVREFAMRHGIPRTFAEPRSLIGAHDLWDALVIAVRVEATIELLADAVLTGRPILVEKPGATCSKDLTALAANAANVIVGYNRRFYRPVVAARDERLGGGPLLASLIMPENVGSPVDGSASRDYLRPFFSNSVHGFDLAQFVLGRLRVRHVSRILKTSGAIQSIGAVLESDQGDVLQFSGAWGSPWNFAFVLERPKRRFELRPFERAVVYEGMQVFEPTPERPLREYRPQVVAEIDLDEVDRSFKPGFVAQARALRGLVAGRDPSPAARLCDAFEALRLAEDLAGAVWT